MPMFLDFVPLPVLLLIFRKCLLFLTLLFERWSLAVFLKNIFEFWIAVRHKSMPVFYSYPTAASNEFRATIAAQSDMKPSQRWKTE